MFSTRKIALVVAVAVGFALIPAGTAAAAPAPPEATGAFNKKERRSQNRQNRKIARTLKDLRALINVVTDERTEQNGISARVGVIEAAAPQIFAGLTALRDGLLQAGDGLRQLRTLATSTEYGIGQVLIGGVPAAGSFIVTPDIPDAAQQGQVSQSFVAGAPVAGQQGSEIKLLVGVRSAENDGTGVGDSAAQCRVTIVSGNNSRTSTPNASLGGAPFHPIDIKSPQTSTAPADRGFPFGPIGSDRLTDLTAGGNSAAPTGVAPVATPGLPYSVTLSCIDNSASASNPNA